MTMFRFLAALMLGVAVIPAIAHDTEQFDRRLGKSAAVRPVPMSCKQLAGPEGFDIDASNPQVVRLFDRCDAKARAAKPAASKAPATLPPRSETKG